MKKKHHSPEQIVTILRQVEAVSAQRTSSAEAAKQVGVSEQSIYRRMKPYGTMDRDEAKHLKELEKENARLKKLRAEKDFDLEILREALSGKY